MHATSPFLTITMEQTPCFNDHALIDFHQISIGDSNEIKRLEHEFETHGWCFIQLSHQHNGLADKLKQVQITLSTFFNQDQAEKMQYRTTTTIGYSRVDHKEGVKVLVDKEGLNNFHGRFNDDMEQALHDLAVLCNSFTHVIKSVIFKMPTLVQSSTRGAVLLSPLGMLDIVHYFNERTGPAQLPEVGMDTNEVNCVPHFDPGLFSLSILSTCDGLQLNDRLENKWIDGPNNSLADQHSIGVLWLGEAASILTENRFKSGIHRVTYPTIPHTPRLTVWQEVCTMSQIAKTLEQSQSSSVIPHNATVQMTNQPNSAPFFIPSGGETVNHFMKRVENERGLSMSKSGVEHLQIRFPIRQTDSSTFSTVASDFFSNLFS